LCLYHSKSSKDYFQACVVEFDTSLASNVIFLLLYMHKEILVSRTHYHPCHPEIVLYCCHYNPLAWYNSLQIILGSLARLRTEVGGINTISPNYSGYPWRAVSNVNYSHQRLVFYWDTKTMSTQLLPYEWSNFGVYCIIVMSTFLFWN